MPTSTSAPPLILTAWTKNYVRKGPIAAPINVTGAIRRNNPGEFEFTVDADHERIVDLTEPGARVVIEHRPAPDEPLRVIYSGRVVEQEGDGTAGTAERTFDVIDDWTVFNNIVGLVNPSDTTPNLSNQKDTGDKAFFTRTGPAETVLKQIVAPNATWMGTVLDIPTTTGLGQTITVAVRMSNLGDKLFPIVDQAGLMARVLQVGTVRRLLCTIPATHTRVLTEASEVVVDVKFARTAPTLTRVVCAEGADEGITRIYRVFINAALEAQIGEPIGTMIEVSGDPIDLDDLMTQAAAEKLAAGAETVSLQLTMAETDTWRYGKTFELGDQVSVRPNGVTDPLTDYVREVGFDWNADDGLLVTPIVGAWDDSPNADLVKDVAYIARVQREMQRSR